MRNTSDGEVAKGLDSDGNTGPAKAYGHRMDDELTEDILGDRERALDQTADEDLPTLAVAEVATRTLAEIVQRLPVPLAEETSTHVAQESHHALWFMSVMAFRAARAALRVIRTGYEDQAVTYVRLIDELHNRAQKVREDPSGEYARQWLAGRPQGKPAKLTGQEMYELLSGPAHANVRAVLDWLAIPSTDGSAKVVLGPERRPDVTNMTLIYIAGEVRDIAAMLIAASGQPLDQLGLLDQAIQAGQIEHWAADVDDDGFDAGASS